jgi:hypothetical protein
MRNAARSLSSGFLVLIVLGACSQASTVPAAPPAVVSTVSSAPTALASLEARFDPTAAVGGGVNASGAISADDIAKVFAAIPQAAQMRVIANSSPPGATGAAVTSVSITAEDTAGVLKTLDANAKKMLGEALLTAAGTAWPQARITLLATDSASGQLIGTRPPGGPNTVIAS